MQQIPIIYWNHNSVKLRSTLFTILRDLCEIEYSHCKFQNKPFALPVLRKLAAATAAAKTIYIVLLPLTLGLFLSLKINLIIFFLMSKNEFLDVSKLEK